MMYKKALWEILLLTGIFISSSFADLWEIPSVDRRRVQRCITDHCQVEGSLDGYPFYRKKDCANFASQVMTYSYFGFGHPYVPIEDNLHDYVAYYKAPENPTHQPNFSEKDIIEDFDPSAQPEDENTSPRSLSNARSMGIWLLNSAHVTAEDGYADEKGHCQMIKHNCNDPLYLDYPPIMDYFTGEIWDGVTDENFADWAQPGDIVVVHQNWHPPLIFVDQWHVYIVYMSNHDKEGNALDQYTPKLAAHTSYRGPGYDNDPNKDNGCPLSSVDNNLADPYWDLRILYKQHGGLLWYPFLSDLGDD